MDGSPTPIGAREGGVGGSPGARGKGSGGGKGTPLATTPPVSNSPLDSEVGGTELETEAQRRDSSLVISPENSYGSGAWNGDDATESREIKLQKELEEVKRQLAEAKRFAKVGE